MENSWRLSKYRPLRSGEARNQNEDWTSIHDIGRVYGGISLNEADYLHVENSYLAASVALHHDAGSPVMRMDDLEIYSNGSIEALSSVLLHEEFDERIAREDTFESVVRMCLRELMWCRLNSLDGAFSVHFGYDYYLYFVGVLPSKKTFDYIARLGLFLEQFRSPYIVGEAGT